MQSAYRARRSNPILGAVAFAAAAALANMGFAASWTGTDPTDNIHWSIPGNWGGTAPSSGDALSFPVTSGNRLTNNDLTIGTQFNGLTFSGANYTLAGNGINLGGNISSSASGSNGTVISLSLTLLQDTDVAVNSTHRVDVSGDITGNFGISKSGTGTMRLTTLQKTYVGNTTIDGGVLDLATDNMLPTGSGKGNLTINAAGTLLLNSSNQGLNGLFGSGTLSKTGSTSKSLTVGNGDANGNFTGTILMTGGSGTGVVKTGLGSQIFGGTVSVPGALTTNGGTSLVNGTWAGASATTGANGKLGGTGAMTLTGAFTVNGRVAPGSNNTGVLDVSAATGATFNASGGLDIELGGILPADGTGNYDQLNFTSTTAAVTLNAASTLQVSFANAFTPSASDVYYIMTRGDAGAFSTLFSGTSEGGVIDLGNGYQANITYLANWAGTQAGSALTGGNDVALYNITAAPEPTALALLGFAGLGLLARRRGSKPKAN